MFQPHLVVHSQHFCLFVSLLWDPIFLYRLFQEFTPVNPSHLEARYISPKFHDKISQPPYTTSMHSKMALNLLLASLAQYYLLQLLAVLFGVHCNDALVLLIWLVIDWGNYWVVYFLSLGAAFNLGISFRGMRLLNCRWSIFSLNI